MKVAVSMLRPEPYYRSDAIKAGLKRMGYDVLTSPRPVLPEKPEDLLLVWNLKAGRDEDMAHRWERAGGTVLVIENGYLQKVDKSYYAISVHGHNGAGWFPVGTENRFKGLGFDLQPFGERDGYWLVCGQRGIGSREMASPGQWADKEAQRLTKMGANVRLRPHPGNAVARVSLSHDLKGAKVCSIWSSGAGVQALVEGVPVIHAAPHWICEGANALNREAKLNRMAHGQWHFSEITSGEPFARILNKLPEARWD